MKTTVKSVLVIYHLLSAIVNDSNKLFTYDSVVCSEVRMYSGDQNC